MNTTLTLVPQTAGLVTSPRLRSAGLATAYACATGIDGRIAGTWSVATRKSMTVPAFHDRWPLCSAT